VPGAERNIAIQNRFAERPLKAPVIWERIGSDIT
jgi:hypothetical protein